MKVWKDANEVIKMIHELPSEKLKETEKEMVSIPKFDRKVHIVTFIKKEKSV